VSQALFDDDYEFDDLVVNPGDLTWIVAVLDPEMATICDPLMHLGTTRDYWIAPDDLEPLRRHQVGSTIASGSLSRRSGANRSGQATGRDVSNMLYYDVFGLMEVVWSPSRSTPDSSGERLARSGLRCSDA